MRWMSFPSTWVFIALLLHLSFLLRKMLADMVCSVAIMISDSIKMDGISFEKKILMHSSICNPAYLSNERFK